ncbi:hypothetical protein FG93_05698 [Bosea sp. LC85]|nr:hypothetical protein FG93_05698 [Bosea sp. LC85]
MIRLAAIALLVTVAQFGVGSPAFAACTCRCINGELRSLCDSSFDFRPMCSAQICPIAPPSIAPIQPLMLPPMGKTSCRQVQALNSDTSEYEWETLCE